MVATVEVAMEMDPTFEAPNPVAAFNDAAQGVVMNNPQAQVANNVNAAPVDPGFSASMSFQSAAEFMPTLAPEPVSQTVEATINPELIQSCENATYALQNMQLSGGSWLTDCMNVAMTAMDNVAGVKQDVDPDPVVQVQPEQVVQNTYTPSYGMSMTT